MPRPKAPPTPSASTEPKALEHIASADMEGSFVLPPPAMRGGGGGEAHANTIPKPSRESTMSFSQSTPPISPQDKPLSSSPRHKRTASGAVKPASEPAGSSTAYALPPPPSRARKIIQMKPKSSTAASSPGSDASYQPTAAGSSSKAPKDAAGSKRKQPSATSAAGRKIARKTAHSIIERRRRSKMNEEFGVLKDMIPACKGVEMHKLAILQAGIEYVRYLEGCVTQLKEENAKGQSHLSRQQTRADVSADRMDLVEDDEDEDDDESDEADEPEQPSAVPSANSAPPSEWSFRDSRKSSVASQQSSAYPSPNLIPQHSQAESSRSSHASQARKRPMLPSGTASMGASPAQISTNAAYTSATPTPTLLSPAFNSIHFSPDLVRTPTGSSVKSSSHANTNVHIASGSGSVSATWQAVNANPSPNMPPLPSPKAAMHLPLPPPVPLNANLTLPPPNFASREAHNKSPSGLSDGGAEATATAALMMLTNDWRNGSGKDKETSAKAKGMSVRDLLTS